MQHRSHRSHFLSKYLSVDQLEHKLNLCGKIFHLCKPYWHNWILHRKCHHATVNVTAPLYAFMHNQHFFHLVSGWNFVTFLGRFFHIACSALWDSFLHEEYIYVHICYTQFLIWCIKYILCWDGNSVESETCKNIYMATIPFHDLLIHHLILSKSWAWFTNLIRHFKSFVSKIGFME